MKTIFECGFGVEAHLISDLLNGEGIANTVLGEYLQGAAGELPVGRLVRVVVEDDQADAARAVIAAWDTAEFVDEDRENPDSRADTRLDVVPVKALGYVGNRPETIPSSPSTAPEADP